MVERNTNEKKYSMGVGVALGFAIGAALGVVVGEVLEGSGLQGAEVKGAAIHLAPWGGMFAQIA